MFDLSASVFSKPASSNNKTFRSLPPPGRLAASSSKVVLAAGFSRAVLEMKTKDFLKTSSNGNENNKNTHAQLDTPFPCLILRIESLDQQSIFLYSFVCLIIFA